MSQQEQIHRSFELTKLSLLTTLVMVCMDAAPNG